MCLCQIHIVATILNPLIDLEFGGKTSMLNCVAFICLPHWPHMLTTVSFQKKKKRNQNILLAGDLKDYYKKKNCLDIFRRCRFEFEWNDFCSSQNSRREKCIYGLGREGSICGMEGRVFV